MEFPKRSSVFEHFSLIFCHLPDPLQNANFINIVVSASLISPSLIHGLCAILASHSRSMRLFQAPLDSPVLCQPLSSRFALRGSCAFEVCLGMKLCGERKKPINIKNFGGTPPGVRPVCPGDTSHLSRDMSRLSRGHSVPLVLIYT